MASHPRLLLWLTVIWAVTGRQVFLQLWYSVKIWGQYFILVYVHIKVYVFKIRNYLIKIHSQFHLTSSFWSANFFFICFFFDRLLRQKILGGTKQCLTLWRLEEQITTFCLITAMMQPTGWWVAKFTTIMLVCYMWRKHHFNTYFNKFDNAFLIVTLLCFLNIFLTVWLCFNVLTLLKKKYTFISC